MSTLSGPLRPDLLHDDFLHDVFIRTAKRYPYKVALRWQNEELTYQQVHHRALKMALALRKIKKIGPDCIVGIRLSRSFELHISIIAVLMTGATYVPFDAETPTERVSEILAGLQAILLLVDFSTFFQHPLALNIDKLTTQEMVMEDHILSAKYDTNAAAYIICTSGTTGKPKSIAISHRSICHLLRAENEVIQFNHNDIVYQGFSAAFDMFFEETFIAFLVGATLVIASKSDILNTDRLHYFFIWHSITVLVCVPTLLLLMNNDPALKLRLINVGGEICPQVLVDRWWKEGRLLFNSYGPTETTVTATVSLLMPGEPITIGTPLPNYICRVLDETTGEPTSADTGELCISGPGVAIEYVRNESLTKEKFTEYGYRTGDRVTFKDGKIFYCERIDSQVKLRGFRMELDEIEQEIMRMESNIQSAAVIVLNGQLIAFVVGQLAETHIRGLLTQRLPHYMLPDRFIQLNESMPRLISGKIDRKALIAFVSKSNTENPKLNPIMIEMSENKSFQKNKNQSTLDIILNAFQQTFPYAHPKPDDDFFLQLSGHSLTAAITITKLRLSFPNIALQDLYECKTAAKLADRLTTKQKNINANIQPDIAFLQNKPTWLMCIMCSIVQAIVFVILCLIASLEFLLPYFIFYKILDHSGICFAYLAAYGTFVVLFPFRYFLAILTKWVVIGRYKEGDYPLWGAMYLRWWTVQQIAHLAAPETLSNTPLMAIYYRLLGAKIGGNVHLGSIKCFATDLLQIDDGTTISSNVILETAFVDNYMLKFRRIHIKRDVLIGTYSVVSGNTTIGDHSELTDLSFLPSNNCIPSNEVWRGSPATYWHRAPCIASNNNSINKSPTPIFLLITSGLIILLFLPMIYFIPIAPGLTLFENISYQTISISSWIQVVIFSPIVGILFTLLVVLQHILIHYLLGQNLNEGIYNTNSFTYIRIWILERVSTISLHVIHTLYATLYISPFLRTLGMKIGRRCEFSTATGMIPSLVEIGDECFIADDVALAEPYIRRGKIHLRKTIIGSRVFVGNTAVVADGIEIPNNCLIGCISLVADGLQQGQSCFGSPAFILPKREKVPANISDVLTYRPTKRLILKRLLIDTVRIFLPRIVIVFGIVIALEIFTTLNSSIGFGLSLLLLPFLYIGTLAIPSLCVCIALKWLLIGRYKTSQHSMWTWFVWRSEFVTSVYEQLAVQMILDFLRGTLLLAPVLRCFGVHVGRGCFINTTDITEFDMIHIGNNVAINDNAGLQTHLFEDRIMKVDEVWVEDFATIGSGTAMLPNTRLNEGATLGPLSLVMKGEGIPARTSWQGIPIQAIHTNNIQLNQVC